MRELQIYILHMVCTLFICRFYICTMGSYYIFMKITLELFVLLLFQEINNTHCIVFLYFIFHKFCFTKKNLSLHLAPLWHICTYYVHLIHLELSTMYIGCAYFLLSRQINWMNLHVYSICRWIHFFSLEWDVLWKKT